jgi:excisionase family DNA binding protein
MTTTRLERLLTIEELSETLQVPVRTLYDWRQKGTGPVSILAGRSLRYRPSDVAAWLDEQVAKPRERKRGRRR